ncbi:MAG: cytosine deaminase [Alsobacter sp.]
MTQRPSIPAASSYCLANATVPASLTGDAPLPTAGDGLACADILVRNGRVAALLPPGEGTLAAAPIVNLDRGMVMPGFIDIHTHLDKGHIWPRRSNPDGRFESALEAVGQDRAANWSASDVEARMDFALRCAFAHGTTAIRTHLDSRDAQTRISWPVFARMRERWAGRIALEASPLFPIDLALDDAHMADILAMVGDHGATLGAVTFRYPQLDDGLDRLFRIASERGWNLDFHVDETLDPLARSLGLIAEKAIHYRFQGSIVAGHCCSLAVQPDDEAKRTIDRVAEARVAVVSLPMCNMYLQSRESGVTPRRRGVTALHELKARGVAVMVASDNTRDPFYAYGDLDMVEVYREATRIAHLDHPVGDWISTVTSTPASILGLEGLGTLTPGSKADLVLFRARSWSEFLSRPWMDRVVLRAGVQCDAVAPDYRELDEILRE